jgi:hypothetical protein
VLAAEPMRDDRPRLLDFFRRHPAEGYQLASTLPRSSSSPRFTDQHQSPASASARRMVKCRVVFSLLFTALGVVSSILTIVAFFKKSESGAPQKQPKRPSLVMGMIDRMEPNVRWRFSADRRFVSTVMQSADGRFTGNKMPVIDGLAIPEGYRGLRATSIEEAFALAARL